MSRERERKGRGKVSEKEGLRFFLRCFFFGSSSRRPEGGAANSFFLALSFMRNHARMCRQSALFSRCEAIPLTGASFHSLRLYDPDLPPACSSCCAISEVAFLPANLTNSREQGPIRLPSSPLPLADGYRGARNIRLSAAVRMRCEGAKGSKRPPPRLSKPPEVWRPLSLFFCPKAFRRIIPHPLTSPGRLHFEGERCAPPPPSPRPPYCVEVRESEGNYKREARERGGNREVCANAR